MAARREGGEWLAAGGTAAVLLPVLVLGLDLPFVAAVPLVGVLAAGVGLVLRPKGRFEGIDPDTAGRSRLELAGKLLERAEPALLELRAAGGRIADPVVSTRILRMADVASAVVAEVEKDPASVVPVQRFLSYYLPRSATTAAAYATMESRPRSHGRRISETASVIGRLEEAFIRYADGHAEDELAGMDVELRLINESLDQDLKIRSIPAPDTEAGR